MVFKIANSKNNVVENCLIVQSNNLVEAYYDTDLTATEHKIIRYALGKVKKSQESFPQASFSVTEFLEAGGIKGRGYHNRIDKVADELSKKRIKIKTQKNTTWMPWLSSLVYENGYVHLTFNIMIKDLLFGVEERGQYTRYNYGYIGDMRSAYTIRLYELLKQYVPIGRRRLRVDTLRNMLGVGEKYQRFSNFKMRVLNQAKEELDNKKELTFDFEEIRQGRRVVEIEFIIHSPKRNIENLESSNAKIQRETFIKEATYLLSGYNIEIENSRLSGWSRYGIELLNEVLSELRSKNKLLGNIYNYPAYIEKILKVKYNELTKKKNQITSDDNNSSDKKNLIIDFINKRKSSEVVPEWFIQGKFIDYMEKHYSEEEVGKLWVENKDYIIKNIKIQG